MKAANTEAVGIRATNVTNTSCRGVWGHLHHRLPAMPFNDLVKDIPDLLVSCPRGIGLVKDKLLMLSSYPA